jgi:peroxiredoxin Q/BCP
VIGISSDTQETLDRFRAALELPYPLVGDPSGAVLKLYGVRVPVLGLAQRVTYVVGRDRRVESAFKSRFDVDEHVAGACRVVLGRRHPPGPA